MADNKQTVSFNEQRPMQALSMDAKQRAVPAYTVEPMKRKTIVNRTVKDEIGFRVVPTDIEVEGYMVRTLRGDSVFVTHDDVVRLKLDKNLVPLFYEGGDDTPAGVQPVDTALTNKQKQTLDILTRLIEGDPNIVEKLLASNVVQVDKEEE